MWVKERLKEYAKGKRQLEASRKLLSPDHPDQVHLAGMISDMAYAIKWMQSGRQPGIYRGVERRGMYREPFVLDKDLFPSLQEAEPVSPIRLTTEQRQAALEAIRAMSDRERDCYLLYATQGLSYAQIGSALGLSRYTVKEYVQRAKSKAQQAI
ncbi:sigma-70 family RNA polymerase sigma factor [Cohnella faecalis]|uniref:Sigma-70 family RNA polymerase sigma factor n=1 Tax=Cohnella faecalis TaxID=2315694 RepID=A0A398CFU5_9BACL|nr:sigma-70 family RNA polymerase sigma factor [Cohnella faecalis]RIE01305.1 sigma-70 family RNA polymerase sigma factor [Cohnella faecalis]